MIPIPPFIAKYAIRFLLIGALAGALFIGGCQYANVQHAEHAADIEKQKTALIAQRTKELNDEWRARLIEEENARVALQFDLDIIQDNERDLLARINELNLTKPVDQVTIESCLENDDENVQLVIANPFNAEFVSVYNDAGRVVRTGEVTGPETD